MPGTFSPIQEQQIGAVAYLFGITTNGQPITITGLASFELDSDDLTYTWKEKENMDTTGNAQNITKTNFKYERTIKLNPSGATRAAAAAYAGSVLNCDALAVANYKVPAFNGNWRIKPGFKLSLKMDDNASIDMPCEMYVNSAQNTALTGAPIVG
jgi:hypothetical protein